jgi:N-acetylglucosamine-6-phosphate deacetylase
MIFRNARMIFPDGIREGLQIVVREGKIAAISSPLPGPGRRGEQMQAGGDEVVDLNGNYLAPGFVDLHVHGALGRDTMEGSPEAFRAICDFHASGGTTSLLLTTATAGVHQLLDHADVIKRITIAPEVPGALEAIEKFHASGISVSGGHSDAWDEDARAAFDRGVRSVTHTFNCMSSARRRGVYRVGGLLEFALSEPQISCELIADGHHVSPTLMKMLYRAKGPRGICLVTDATPGAGLQDGSHFSLFGNDCLVEDGVCLLADRSALAGSASRMIDLIQTMVRHVDVPLHEAVKMATENPADAISIQTKGRLQAGADADFVVLSPELQVLRTFVAGEQVWSY